MVDHYQSGYNKLFCGKKGCNLTWAEHFPSFFPDLSFETLKWAGLNI